MSKIQFWKQFTTYEVAQSLVELLYSICQRYNFESNLQLELIKPIIKSTVFDMSKIQFWKQFTTVRRCSCPSRTLYSICQRYNFESNLQQKQGDDLKAYICQRYNFESNLQPAASAASAAPHCIRYVKDTILKAIYNIKHVTKQRMKTVFDMSKIQFWKQFTTEVSFPKKVAALYSICQRYNFESNLQRIGNKSFSNDNCIRYVKDTILKANSQRVCVHVCI